MRFSFKLTISWLLNIVLGSLANIWIIPFSNKGFYKVEYHQHDWLSLWLGNILFSSFLSVILFIALMAFYHWAKHNMRSVHQTFVIVYWAGTLIISLYMLFAFDYKILTFLFAYILCAILLFKFILNITLYHFFKK